MASAIASESVTAAPSVAHPSVAGIENLRWRVATAWRGGLTAREVLDTLEAPAFRAAVKP